MTEPEHLIMNRYLSACLLLVALATVGSAAPSLKEARVRLLSGNYEEAQSQYEQLAKEPKNQPGAAIGLSKALQNQGEYDKALTVLDEAVKDHAQSADLQARRAQLLYLRGRWEDAEKAAQSALAVSKDHFLARWIQAQIARDRGDLKKAAEEMLWFVRTYNGREDIKDPDDLLVIGLAAAEHARWNKIADQFQDILTDLFGEALKNDKHFWPAEYQAGLLLLEKYNRGEALGAFDNALKINPQSAETLAAKGVAALMRFEIKDAEQLAERALKINENLPEGLRLRSDVFLAEGDTAKALKELERARKINPRDERTLARIAACFHLQKKKDELEALAAEVAKFDSKPALFYYELGERLEERKRYDEAETYFKKAAELRPNLPGPSNSLGMLYMRLGKEQEAATLLQKGFKADQFNVRVSNQLKVLRHLEKYETIKTRHFELRYDPKHDPALAQYMADYLEEIHKSLAGKFDYDLKGPILIEVFNNHEMFSGRTVALPDLHTIGACTGRMVAMVSPKGRGISKPFNWARVLRHEVVHIFNLEQTHYLVPHWLTEGLAVSNEGFPRPQTWNQLLLERVPANELLNLDTIDLGFIRPRNPLEWHMAYCQSQLYVEYLQSKYGKEVIGKLLAAFRDGLSTTEAIERVCKVEKAEFEKGYKAFLEETVKGMKGKPAEKKRTLAQLKQDHEKNPADLDTAAALAEALMNRDRVQARALAQKVLDSKRNHPKACLVLARLSRVGGDVKQEQEYLERGLDREDPDPRLVLTLGKIYYDAREFQKAGEMFELGRKAEPYENEWLQQLTRVYAQTGDRDKHIAVLKDLVPTDADDLDRRKRLTRLLLEKGDYAEAEKYARQGMEIDLTDKEVQESLFKALEGQKKNDEAERMKKLLGK